MADNAPIDIIRSHQDDLDRESARQEQKLHPHSPAVEPDEKYERDVPPDGGYGWVCVACVFWINAHTWGINSSYGVFLSHYLSHNVFPDTSPLFYAFTGGLSISCALLVAPLATHFIHKWGTRFVLNLGIFFETLSLIGSSFATLKWHIMLSQGVCFGWGMGFLFVGSVGIAPQWFNKRRSVAMGITAAGSGLGGLIYSLAVGAIIPRYGLGWAFRILGIISCVVNLVCCNLLRDRNKAVGSRFTAFHLPLLRRPEFLLFLGWGVFSMLGYVALLFSVANFALSVGLSSHQGSIVSALLNLGQGLGRPCVGMFSDRLGRMNIATLLTFLCGLFCLVIWTSADNMGVVCFFAILVGTVSGTYWATVSPVLVEIIGIRDLPSGLSITWITLVSPCTVSEAIALQLRSSSGGGTSYLRVQLFTGFMYIGAALCLWLVRGWKVGEIERAQREDAMPVAPLTKAEKETTGSVVNTPAEPVQTAQLWSPVSLVRRMVTMKRV
ncbi:unnamed protein product [Penicillium salamii]|uniref:Major facilitator superfamily (MFS) profile domain-containing protein n=1 Tax=Penicillium salamii TaxID=1612424 RepID=A0A9W4NFG2_9EURO|nr:unnamed protein product [Penicillium salamii]CAG8365806.1 unnamed protein product [Penicillium salamii]CAG8367073.1 unnamed protein product [Penicillium salamii]CAG8382540.1 unnamed protein product [Penicillium salamii]